MLAQGQPRCACEPGGSLEADGKHCRHWGPVLEIETSEATGIEWASTVEANGAIRVVWATATGTDANEFAGAIIRSAVLAPDLSFMDAPQLGTVNQQPELVFNKSFGQALVLLSREGNNALLAYQLQGNAWSSPARLATRAGANRPALPPTLAAVTLANGHSLAVFRDERADGQTSLFAARHAADTGWSTAMEVPDTEVANFGPALALLGENRAILVWVDPRNRVLARQWSEAQGWEAVSKLSDESDPATEIVSYPQVVVDERGNALILWYVDRFAARSGRMDQLYARAFESGAWGQSMLVAELKSYAHFSAASSSVGHVLLTWRQELEFDQKTPERVWARAYTVLGGWANPAPVSDEFKQYNTLQAAALDRSGNAVVVWLQPGQGEEREVWANQFLAGAGWVGPVSIGSSAGFRVPFVMLDAEARATVLWSTYPVPGQKIKLLARVLE